MNHFQKVFSFLIVLMLFMRSSIFAVFSWVGTLYYAVLILFTVYSVITLLIGKNRFNPDFSLLWFVLIGLFSILLNNINPFFQPYQRYFGFVMIAIAFGPLFMSIKNVEVKLLILYYFKEIGVFFTIISFFMKMANVFTPISSIFSFGLAYHDMTMAPIAFITALLVLNDILQKNYKNSREKYYKILIFVLCMACGMLCGSRGAIGSCLIAIIIYIMQISRGGKKAVYLGVFGILALLVYTTNPYGILDHFFEKMDRDQDDMSYVLSGRDKMVQDRIADFKSSPIYGVGFASMKNISRSKVNFEKGIIESGSSWFLILGSTGSLGILFYVLTLINNMVKPIKNKENCVLSACVCFFILHSMVEGYIISFGAPLCAFFWLLLGILRSRIEFNKIII